MRPVDPRARVTRDDSRRVRWWPHALILVAALALTLVSIGPLWLAALLWLALAWFAAPGVLVARLLYGREPGSWGAALLVGPLWGFAISSLVLLALWAAGLRHWTVLLLAPPGACVAWLLLRPLHGELRPPALSRRDLPALLLLLCLVPLVVGRPYARVGEEGPDGRAYRAYFTADFVWTMAVVAEVSKGEVPPRNQFLRRAPLHYYWTSHLISAVEYRHLSRLATLESILLLNAVAFGLMFVAFLYLFTRPFTRSPALAATACAAAILLTSFEGLERLLVIWREGLPLDVLRTLNIDAVTRWFYGALPVDGLHRVLLYQPQHHATAYALGFSALLVLARARRPDRPMLVGWVGVLLAASVLISAFAAIMLTLMAAVYTACLLAARRAWRAVLPCALAGAAPLAMAAGAALALRFVDRSGSILEVMVNPAATSRMLTTIPLSFGPMLATVTAGLAIGLVRRQAGVLPLTIVVGLSALFYFFVNVRDHQDVYVGWRAGHLIFMAAAPLTALVFEALARARRAVRYAGVALAGALALAAAPTVIIDLYNTQDTGNRAMGPGFPWTLVLGPDELEALRWIKQSTPPHALVQPEPSVRAPATWAWVPAFAERRMAAGLPISMVPLARYEAASHRVRELYLSETAKEAFERAARLRIDFLVVGPPERQAYPAFEQMLDADGARFPVVFRNASMTIYFVSGGVGPLARDGG
jgi:hypothetical protein